LYLKFNDLERLEIEVLAWASSPIQEGPFQGVLDYLPKRQQTEWAQKNASLSTRFDKTSMASQYLNM
jgi:hypothetical protein